MSYFDCSAMRLLELLWIDYGRQVAVDGKGRVQIVSRTFPAVPLELHRSITEKAAEVKALLAKERLVGGMEREAVGDLVK